MNISDTFGAMVAEAEQGFARNATVYYGTLVDGQKFRFCWQRASFADQLDQRGLEAPAAKLGLGDTFEAAERDERASSVPYGENHWKELRETEFKALMLDLLKLHPMAPPLPLQVGDVVAIDGSLDLLKLLKRGYGGWTVTSLDDDGQRDSWWLSSDGMRRVERYATGTHKDGTPWRLDQIHDEIRLISGDTVIDGPSSSGKAGASSAFETLWDVFSNGRPGSYRSDRELVEQEAAEPCDFDLGHLPHDNCPGREIPSISILADSRKPDDITE